MSATVFFRMNPTYFVSLSWHRAPKMKSLLDHHYGHACSDLQCYAGAQEYWKWCNCIITVLCKGFYTMLLSKTNYSKRNLMLLPLSCSQNLSYIIQDTVLHYSGTSMQLYFLQQRFLLGEKRKLTGTSSEITNKAQHLNIPGSRM